jgi:uncharacterized hydrophobic protein (TIGR00271 family)
MSEVIKKAYLVYGSDCEEISPIIQNKKYASALMSVDIESFLKDNSIDESDRVIVVASVDDIKRVFKKAKKDRFSVAMLSLKDQKRLRQTFEIPIDIEDALEIALESQPKDLDILSSDSGDIVLWGALVGDAPPLSYKSVLTSKTSFKDRYHLLIESFKKLKDLKVTNIKLITQKEQKINTAATGVVVIEHDNHTCASSLVRDALSLSDGKLSALLVSPTSIVDYLRYLYVSIFNIKQKNLPNSVGFIKSESLLIESEKPLNVMIDGNEVGETPIKFEIDKKAIRYCGSEKFWEKSIEGVSEKETVKLSALPITSEGVKYQEESLPFFTHAGEEKYRDLFAGLREQGKLESTFIIMMLLSTILATVGLFLNSSSVIIGAMLIAPLMQPIVTASMGVLRSDIGLISNAFKTVGIGIAIVLITSSFIALLLPFENLTSEISARLHPSLLDLIVALISGVAAAYAKNNEKIVGSLVGVSIAVALVPPIATAGIGIGWMQFSIFYQAFLLFLTNFVGIIFAGALTFLVMGFSPIKRAKRGLLYATFVALIVAIPLYLSYKSIALDSKIRTALEKGMYNSIKIENVVIEHRDKLVIKCDLIVLDLLSSDELKTLKKDLRSKLDMEVVLEVIQRVRI